MLDGSIDVGSLEGDALTRWYRRSPAEIEQERRAATAKQVEDFFNRPSGTNFDPGFAREIPGTNYDVDAGYATGSPRTRLGSTRPAVSEDRSARSAFGIAARTPASPRPTSRVRPGSMTAFHPGANQTISYGALRAPGPSGEELAELRRQQGAFGGTLRKIDLENSWAAVPALAPAAVALGLGAAGEWATGEVPPAAGRAVANFVDSPIWQRGAQKVAQALSDAEKTTLRAAARAKFARANGVSASEMQAEVHHSDPLEWAHLKPDADPNRLANLWGLRREAHAIASREWASFTKSLEGRIPSQAEIMEAKLRIDRLVEPYIRRAGLPRSNRLPGKGGPL